MLKEDFLMMFIHHLPGTVLITFSYINNMARVGALTFCRHDSSDPKLASYARHERLCNTLFVISAASFMVTGLGVFLLWILSTTLFESWKISGPVLPGGSSMAS